jgi:hypothetical protein
MPLIDIGFAYYCAKMNLGTLLLGLSTRNMSIVGQVCSPEAHQKCR